MLEPCSEEMFGFTSFLRAPKYVCKYEYKIDVNHAVALEANGLRSGIKSLYKGITMKVMMFIPHLMFHRVGELNLWCL